jgi:hypothetical protein
MQIGLVSEWPRSSRPANRAIMPVMAERKPRPAEPDPGAQQSVSAALDAVRASRAELEAMRRRREEAMERTSKAMRKLRGEEEPPAVAAAPTESLQDRIDRISRMVELASKKR